MSAVDQLPEQIHYRDDGCSLAPKCLECPLPECRYCMPPKRAGALLREAELRTLLDAGHTADECAELMRVSRRTIFRVKKFKATTAMELLQLVERGA